MRKFLRAHEAFVKTQLEAGANLEQLAAWHERHIARFQHERLIHLHVTLACCVLLFLAFAFAVDRPEPARWALAGLLLVLVAGYLHHYWVLENGVQRWYHLANEIDVRRGIVATRYDR
jgi:hypothetical protein